MATPTRDIWRASRRSSPLRGYYRGTRRTTVPRWLMTNACKLGWFSLSEEEVLSEFCVCRPWSQMVSYGSCLGIQNGLFESVGSKMKETRPLFGLALVGECSRPSRVFSWCLIDKLGIWICDSSSRTSQSWRVCTSVHFWI